MRQSVQASKRLTLKKSIETMNYYVLSNSIYHLLDYINIPEWKQICQLGSHNTMLTGFQWNLNECKLKLKIWSFIFYQDEKMTYVMDSTCKGQ